MYRDSVDFILVDDYKDRKTLDDKTTEGILVAVWKLASKHGLAAFECESWLHLVGQVATRTATISMIVRRARPLDRHWTLPSNISASPYSTNSTWLENTSDREIRCTYRIMNPNLQDSRICLYNIKDQLSRYWLNVRETKYLEGAMERRLRSLIGGIGAARKVREVTATDVYWGGDKVLFYMQVLKRNEREGEVKLLIPDGAIGVLVVVETLIVHKGLMSYDGEVYVDEVHAATLKLTVVKGRRARGAEKRASGF